MSDTYSVHQAQERILAVFNALEAENVPLIEVFGRVLANPVFALRDAPSFTNSSMDGFAVRSIDVTSASQDSPVRLAVVEDLPAGSVPTRTLEQGQAARIMTGASLPPEADAVVPVEDTHLRTNLEGPLPFQVEVIKPAQPGQYIRPRGQDIKTGQLILKKDTPLRPQDVGMLASLGLAQVSVHRKPKVALFSSGNELADPGADLQPGQIFDSNQFFLTGLLRASGAEVIRLGTAKDDPADIERLLSRAIDAAADLIVTSGGVSVGAFDYIRQVIEANGRIDFWRVNMRPGKPLAFGEYKGIPLVGLPGNPVSAFVGSFIFVLPVIRKLSGLTAQIEKPIRATIIHPIESDGRESYLRARVTVEDNHYVARLSQHQGSGNLYSLVDANALLIVPSEVKSLPAGYELEVLFIGGENR